MKKHQILQVISLLVTAGIAGYLYLQLAPEQEQVDISQEISTPETAQETTPAQKIVKEIAQELESPEETLDIPDEVYEELDVTDVEVRVESIAAIPDVWRQFINAPVNHSDPKWEFGCYYFLDTGGTVILDVFTDEVGNTWVAEATKERLIGIGLMDPALYEKVAKYYRLNEEVACLEVTHRNYATYTFLGADLELINEFDQWRLMTGDVYMPLPKFVYDSFNESRDAVLLGTSLMYQGYDGIEVFDIDRWEASLVYDFIWRDMHGLSSFVAPQGVGNRVALGLQPWDEETSFVIVYEWSEAEGLYELGRSTADLAWELGVNGTANLAFPQDLMFTDEYTLQIIEYPEFNDKIVSGDFPPDTGEMKVTNWGLN